MEKLVRNNHLRMEMEETEVVEEDVLYRRQTELLVLAVKEETEEITIQPQNTEEEVVVELVRMVQQEQPQLEETVVLERQIQFRGHL